MAAQRDRSPSYPIIPLGVALERLVAFDSHFKRRPARAEKVGEAWEIKAKAYADRTAAALRYYGLIDYENVENCRQIVISEEGRMYLRAQQEHIKQEIIKKAALRPAQIGKFWNLWGADRPADDACIDDLTFKNSFSDKGAQKFLKVYDSTITFAGLSDSDKILDEGNDGDGDTGSDFEFSVGDMVNWESGGQIQWTEPREIIAIDKDENGQQFYQVRGLGEYADEIGWIPMEQATQYQSPDTLPENKFSPPPPGHGAVPVESRKAVFPVLDGDVVLVFPKDMTAGGLDELGQYLEIFLKKERRTKEKK